MKPLAEISKINSVLFLGAHSDDIEIGCGGTVLRLLEANPSAQITWIVFGGNEQRQHEARDSANAFLKGAKNPRIETNGFRDAFFPYDGEKIKSYFEMLKKSVNPDVIFTHYRDDKHQDHRTINGFTWNTWRSNTILEYEIPKYDADLAQPNLFSPLSDGIVNQKVELLMSHFASQRSKQWFDPETFKAYLRIRGIECDSPTKWAEAFHCRKIIL